MMEREERNRERERLRVFHLVKVAILPSCGSVTQCREVLGHYMRHKSFHIFSMQSAPEMKQYFQY